MGTIGRSILDDINTGVLSEIEERNRNREASDDRRRQEADDIAYAENYALRKAEEGVVRKFWPDHPIFTERGLPQRIGDAGAMAWRSTGKWDAVAEAGKSFALPDFDYTTRFTAPLEQQVAELRFDLQRAGEQKDDLQREIETLRTRVQFLEGEVATGLQVCETMEAENRRLDVHAGQLEKSLAQHLAISQALRRRLEQACPQSLLVSDSSVRQRLGDRGYQALVDTRDWKQVRAVGDSFVDGSRSPSADFGGEEGASPAAEAESSVETTFDSHPGIAHDGEADAARPVDEEVEAAGQSDATEVPGAVVSRQAD